jgi:hypothetical protein
MPPSYPSSFGGRHILQIPLTVGDWNLPSYESTMREVSAQLCDHSTYYTMSTYPSPAMSVPTNTFPMENVHLSSSVPYGGIHPYSMGNPPHEVPFFGGNTYPHMSNPCHVSFSSQAASMPLQPIMNRYGGGYYPTKQGHGIYQNPSWPAISQNQSFLAPWSQIPQFTIVTSLVIACHTSITSPTSVSHVGYWSTTSASHVEDLQPAVVSHDGGTSPVITCHIGIISPTSASHVGDWSTTSTSHVEDLQPASASHAGSMSPSTTSHVGGIHMIENPRRLRCKPRFL